MAENAALGVSSLAMLYFSSGQRMLLVAVHCWSHAADQRDDPFLLGKLPGLNRNEELIRGRLARVVGVEPYLVGRQKVAACARPQHRQGRREAERHQSAHRVTLLGVSGSRSPRRRTSASVAC